MTLKKRISGLALIIAGTTLAIAPFFHKDETKINGYNIPEKSLDILRRGLNQISPDYQITEGQLYQLLKESPEELGSIDANGDRYISPEETTQAIRQLEETIEEFFTTVGTKQNPTLQLDPKYLPEPYH